MRSTWRAENTDAPGMVDALLLRPDRVVAAAAGTPDLRAWQRHLRTAGINPAESPQDVRSPR